MQPHLTSHEVDALDGFLLFERLVIVSPFCHVALVVRPHVVLTHGHYLATVQVTAEMPAKLGGTPLFRDALRFEILIGSLDDFFNILHNSYY